MIYSSVKFDKNSQDKLKTGIHTLERAVSSTLGPLGRNVSIAYANDYGVWQRTVVHDGVTVARSIMLKDEFEDMGAQLLKQAAQKQVDMVGDGTTVSIILARAIYDEVSTLIATGVNPMQLRRSIEEQVELLTKEIRKHAIPVKSYKQKKHIATISAEDEKLGELVAKVIDEMGEDGLVTVEESKNAETKVEKIEGMQLDKGFVHDLFKTSEQRNESVLENPRLLITDKPINSLEPFIKLLEECVKNGRQLFMISPSFSTEVLAAMLTNKRNGLLQSLLVAAPSFGKNQKNTLQDIAIFTGGRFISEESGDKFEDVTLDDLGKAEYITATRSDTLIVGGKGKKEDIQERIASIRKDINEEEVEFDREKMRERLAKLTTGVAVIKVGGITEVEMKERLERAKDAVAATKAALADGIVPGGETIYLRIRSVLPTNSLLYHALYKPFKKLMENAGLNDGEWYEKLNNTVIKHAGVDVTKGEIVDMVHAGIIDPTAVSINALKNAASVAIQLATTGCTVIQYSTTQK